MNPEEVETVYFRQVARGNIVIGGGTRAPFLSRRIPQLCHAAERPDPAVTRDSGLSQWLEELGLPCVDTIVTMVPGPAPIVEGSARIVGLASQALG